MSGFVKIIARTGHVEEISERMVLSISGPVLEASTEENAIRIATEKFQNTADQIKTINPDFQFNPKGVGAMEIWSEDDLIGWDVDSEFYEV